MDLRQIAKILGVKFKVFLDFLAHLFGRRQMREIIIPEKPAAFYMHASIRLAFRDAVMGLSYAAGPGVKPAPALGIGL